MKTGKLFSSAEELKAAIKTFEKQNFVNLSILDCKTLIATKIKRHKSAKPCLRYSHIVYSCIHGRKFKPQGKRKRKGPDEKPFATCTK